MSDLPTPTTFLLDVLPASRPLLVLDVGANPLEDPPYGRLLRGCGCHVTGFEPQWDAFKQLRDAAGPNETYHCAALGRGGEETLHITRETGFTSLRPPSRAGLDLTGWTEQAQVLRREPVRTVRMDDVRDLPQQDVLKIDVQGFELEVIAGGRGTLADAVAIISEVRFARLYRGEPMFGAFDTAMREAGYGFLKFLHVKSAPIASSQSALVAATGTGSQAIDGDAVYVRDLTRPDALSDDQLCHLALAAEAILDSSDLALFCLDRLAERSAVGTGTARTYAELVASGAMPMRIREAAE